MPTVVCLAGPQGPQYTSLLHGLAAELTRRGLKVGLVSRGQAPASPPPGGALVELRLSQDGLSLHHGAWQPPTLAEIVARHGQGLDVLLSEVHQDHKVYKIEYCPPGASPSLLGDPNLKALVAEQPLPTGPPCFSPQDFTGLTDLLAGLLPQPARPLLQVLVDGRRLPAKDFVQEIMASTIRALVGALKGGQDAKRIEVHIQ
ncbi:MAG: hypothetical protein HY794_07435 [Desulfarculus sp.]|nr:hypothetical protein [Desulfarculus sp.]